MRFKPTPPAFKERINILISEEAKNNWTCFIEERGIGTISNLVRTSVNFYMDLDSKMYVCYGTSLKSEKDAYNKAMEMLKTTEIKIKSLRLDRYYSNPGDINKFKGCKVYFIPKKNVTMQHGLFWNERLTEFVNDTFGYLKEYFKRNNSESGFSEDKKLMGWKIAQKREDRIDTAIFTKVIWRNLFHLYS